MSEFMFLFLYKKNEKEEKEEDSYAFEKKIPPLNEQE